MSRELVFLGTGNGMPKRSSCSSILLRDGTQNLLIDTGGGQDLVRNLFAAGIDPKSISDVFISHYDSDHILGIVPLVRTFNRGGRNHTIHCSADVKKAVDSLFQYVAADHHKEMGDRLTVNVANDRSKVKIGNWAVTFFDIKSPDGSPQLGLVVEFAEGKKLVFLGDEPMRNHYLDLVQGADVMIHDAFCLARDEAKFEPHPKNHSTVAEAAMNAVQAGTKSLLLFHMEDDTLATRKEEYAKEAKAYFQGEVFVPIDLDVYTF